MIRSVPTFAFTARGPYHAIGLLEGLVVGQWRAGVDPVVAFDAYVSSLREASQRSPKGVGSLAIIDAANPPSGLQEAAHRIYTEFGPKLVCLARVIETHGFRAAAFHSALSALNAKAPCKTANFDCVNAAASWAAATMRASVASTFTTEQVVEAVEEIKASLGSRSDRA